MKLIKKIWRLYRIRKVTGSKNAKAGVSTLKSNLYGNDDDLGFC